jgi:uncharacterized membrane protein YccC
MTQLLHIAWQQLCLKHAPADSLAVMVVRICGILAGTFISLLIAATVYPVSATEQCLEGIKKALHSMSRLCAAAVQEGHHAFGKARKSKPNW